VGFSLSRRPFSDFSRTKSVPTLAARDCLIHADWVQVCIALPYDFTSILCAPPPSHLDAFIRAGFAASLRHTPDFIKVHSASLRSERARGTASPFSFPLTASDTANC
jgi:hypothetical protein